MKKIFTIVSLMMLFAFNASAQGVSWDFTKWSTKTLQALKTDMEVNGVNANWRNYESDASKADEQHYWIARKMAGTLVTNDGTDDTVIPETEGLTFGASAAKKLVISYNHENRAEHGAFLWFNGKNETMTVPNVVGGQTLKIAVESHKSTEARGFTITHNGTALTSPTGNFTPMEYTEYEVELPEGTGDLVFKTTNGCHLFYVIVGNGGQKEEKNYKIGYLYYEAAGKGFEELPLYAAIKDIENTTYEPIKVDDATPTKEQLMAYDAIVLDGSLPADAELVASLKQNIQWQPTLNVNGKLAEALGYGTAVEFENEQARVLNKKKNWFSGFESYTNDDQNAFYITNGEVFPTPLVLTGHAGETALVVAGTDDEQWNDSVIAYVRNNAHNEYVYFGADADYGDGVPAILKNVVDDLLASKTEIKASAKPSIIGSYKEMESTVIISAANKNAVIYYTTDGSEPTTESTVYTEPLVFTSECTVKAVALIEGYTLSEVAELDVKLYHQAKTPTITITYPEGKDETNGDALITFSSDEDVDIYYNFTGSENVKQSTAADSVVVAIKHAATVTAFAIGKDGAALVQSNSVQQDVKANMLNVRRDVLVQFDANKTAWDVLDNIQNNGVTYTAWVTSNYYFTWGKTAKASYVTSEDPEVDENGDLVLDENGDPVFKKIDIDPEVTTSLIDEDWKLASQGQVMIYQTNSITTNVGDGNGYNPERAEDYSPLCTTNDIQFGAKASGDKYTARIESTKKYQGPFNVVFFAATTTGSAEKLAVQVSEDGANWETVGDTLHASNVKRLYKQFEVPYNENKEVYLRVKHAATGSGVAIHNIYVYNHGELSAAEEAAYSTGIQSVATEEATEVKAKKYFLDGRLVIETANGVFSVSGARVK